jgi:hypothetical protein
LFLRSFRERDQAGDLPSSYLSPSLCPIFSRVNAPLGFRDHSRSGSHFGQLTYIPNVSLLSVSSLRCLAFLLFQRLQKCSGGSESPTRRPDGIGLAGCNQPLVIPLKFLSQELNQPNLVEPG